MNYNNFPNIDHDIHLYILHSRHYYSHHRD